MSAQQDVDSLAADAIAFAQSHAHVDHLLRRITEVLEELFVAGLAYPNPDLSEELPDLAERATHLGLATPAAALEALTDALGRIREASEEARPAAIEEAWEITQRLGAWQRLFRREHALLIVAGRLAAGGDEAAIAPPKVPTADLSAWPIGAHLKGESLSLFALEIDSGQAVLLHDQLSELREDAPLARPVISRLFQAQISLRGLLSSVIRLEGHPVAARGGIIHANPAFRCAPRIIEVASTFTPPEVRAITPAEINKLVGRAEVWLDAEGRTFVAVDGDPLPIAVGETLAFNLTKWRALHLDVREPLAVTLLPQDEAALVIAAEDDWGDMALPQLDPYAYRWRPADLYEQACEAPSSLAQLYAQTVTGALGGVTLEEEAEALRVAWSKAEPEGILAWGRAMEAWSLLGIEPPEGTRVRLVELADLVLSVGATPKKQKAVDAEALGEILGVDPASLSTPSRRQLKGGMIFTALQVLARWADLEPRAAALEAAFEARYRAPGSEPTVGDVCARAALLDMLQIAPDLDGEEDEDEHARVEAAQAYALDYLEAFLRDLRPRAGRPEPAPLPAPRELLWYAQARGLILGEDPLRGGVSGLSLPRLRAARSWAEALLRWARAPQAEVEIWEGAEALLCAVSGHLAHHFVAL